MAINRFDPRVRDIQKILGNRFGLGSQVVVDGDLGPRTWNGTTMVLGYGWWSLSPDGIVAALGARSPANIELPAYPFPERVRIAQARLNIIVDGFLGPQTWKALSAKLPSWKTRVWEASQSGNIPDALGANSSETGVVSSAPVIKATTQVAPDGTVNAKAMAEALAKLRARGGAAAAAAADAADSAADQGFITQRQHDEVIATKPGKKGLVLALAGAGALGVAWYFMKGRRHA